MQVIELEYIVPFLMLSTSHSYTFASTSDKSNAYIKNIPVETKNISITVNNLIIIIIIIIIILISIKKERKKKIFIADLRIILNNKLLLMH